MQAEKNGVKRAGSPVNGNAPSITSKQRDSLGFRLKRQTIDKNHLTAYETLGGDDINEGNLNIVKTKTIFDEEAEGASYILDGRLRRVHPYYFTYLTYCKMRWRDRKLLDVFTGEFRDRDAEYYKKMIASGQVALNHKPTNIDSIIKNGDLISHRCHKHEPSVSSKPIKIIFENDEIIAIDKPSGIPVHPSGRYRYNTITKIFEEEFGKKVHPCNRLDRLTSGLMFLGKTAKGTDKFVQQIKDRTVKKEYIARVVGDFPIEEILVDKPLRIVSPKHCLNRVDRTNGKEAKTNFKKIAYDPETNTSIVRCVPLTGRTHQIRVHLQYIGHPIANDPIYSSDYVWGPNLGKNEEAADADIIERLDTIGKTVASSSWIHPQKDGELLSGKHCEECGIDLYTDPGPNDLDLWLHAYKYEAADNSWSYTAEYPEWVWEPFKKYMELAIVEASKCGETQTQYNVGAVLVNDGEIIATGYSRELPGNTHAEQNALEKYYSQHKTKNVPADTQIYTTMEPCSKRLSGNLPCLDRIIGTNINACFVGVMEPDTFVQNNSSLRMLTQKGIPYIKIPGYEEECLKIAKKGHEKINSN